MKLGKQDEQKVGDDGQDEFTFFFIFNLYNRSADKPSQ